MRIPSWRRTVLTEADAAVVALLEDAFVARQGLDRGRAKDLAKVVAGGPKDVARAAAAWATTGEMPDEPAISGETPASLADRLPPSRVFTGLQALRTNPAVGVNLLHHPPNDARVAAREWEDRVQRALSAIPGIEIDCYPLGPDRRSRPDFIAHLGDFTAVVEAKAIPARTHWVRRAIDQVERYVLVFGVNGGLIVVPEAPPKTAALESYLATVWVVALPELRPALERMADAAPRRP